MKNQFHPKKNNDIVYVTNNRVYHKSAGGIVLYINDKSPLTALLQWKEKNGWTFPKGHVKTKETIKQTIAFAKKLNPDTVAFFQASPYPGTEFYKIAQKAGYIREDAQWIDYAIVSDKPSVIDLPRLSAEEIYKWVKKAYKSFYFSSRYIFSRIKKINSWKAFTDNLKGLKILFSIVKNN